MPEHMYLKRTAKAVKDFFVSKKVPTEEEKEKQKQLEARRTKEILESALTEYQGTLLFISHDRYFINNLASKIIYIENNKLKEIPGNYEDYKRYKRKEN